LSAVVPAAPANAPRRKPVMINLCPLVRLGCGIRSKVAVRAFRPARLDVSITRAMDGETRPRRR